MNYRQDIDGLRALAVIPVVLFHFFPSLITGGFIGVDIFFVISGYLISYIIFEELFNNKFSFLSFYKRRVRRLFPALIIVIFLVVLVGYFVLSEDEYNQLAKHTIAGAFFVSNFILWSESGYFDTLSQMKPLLHLWSLGIEEQYYILWPIAIYLLWRFKIFLPIVIIIFIFISFVMNIQNVNLDLHGTFYLPFYRFWELLVGALLAWLMFNKYYLQNILINNVLSLIGILMILFGMIVFNRELAFPGFYALVPVVGATLIIYSGSKSLLNKFFLSNQIIVYFGKISYPLYLIHWPIISYMTIILADNILLPFKLIGILISILLASLIYVFIEKPIRSGLLQKNIIEYLIFLMITTVVFAIYVSINKGIPERSVAQKLSSINLAKKDWHYIPTKLIDKEIVGIHNLSVQNNKGTVLWIGDSFMGQYWHRLEMLYNSEDSFVKYNSQFASRNHCYPAPLQDIISGPESASCIEYYNAALKLAYSSNVNKIVLAGNWPRFRDSDGNLTLQATKFIKDLKELSQKNKKIFLIAKHPINSLFEPSLLINNRLQFSILEKNLFVNRNSTQDNKHLQDMEIIAKLSNSILINPLDFLCTSGECEYVRGGYPLYTDENHMNATYVRSQASFVDEILK